MNVESVTHDTDALLVQYAPQSRDVDVCISKMQDHIEQLERERDEARANRDWLKTQRDKDHSEADIERREVMRLRKIITDADHSMDCESRKYYMAIVDEDCDCWKSEVSYGSG